MTKNHETEIGSGFIRYSSNQYISEDFITLYVLVPSADNFCKTVWTQIRPDKVSGLIWVQPV